MPYIPCKHSTTTVYNIHSRFFQCGVMAFWTSSNNGVEARPWTTVERQQGPKTIGDDIYRDILGPDTIPPRPIDTTMEVHADQFPHACS
jgi:hypothetical protein